MEYRSYRCILLGSYLGKVLHKLGASILCDYCEVKRLLPKEYCRFCLDRSTTEVMFVVRRLQ